MKITPEFLDELKNASKKYLDEVSTRILFVPSDMSFEQIDEITEIWRTRCAELGLEDDYRFVPSELYKYKLKQISLDGLDIQNIKRAKRELSLLLAESKFDSVSWRIKFYKARKELQRII